MRSILEEFRLSLLQLHVLPRPKSLRQRYQDHQKYRYVQEGFRTGVIVTS